MKKIFIIILQLFFCLNLFAQDKALTLNEFLSIVKSYHPLAQQARLNADKARLTKQQAIGGFDPKLEVNSARKILDGKTYYDQLVPEVKVPLWYGIELKGSYSRIVGDRANPEEKTGTEGLGYLGLSMPLGRGLFLDERRAALRQANIYSSAAANEQQQMLNDLFVAATQTYAEWLNAYLNTTIYNQAVKLAEVRFEGTKMLYKNGDKPAIDTLEALTLLQSRQQKLAEYELVLANRKNELATYMWQEGNQAVDLTDITILPDTLLIRTAPPDTLINKPAVQVAELNPEIKNYGLKLQQLDIERRLKLEEVKPTVNFNLGVLNSGRNIFQNLNAPWLANNQKFGFTVAMPLTFTKQRASYSLSKIKLLETEFALMDKKNALVAKWNNYRNDYFNTENQIRFNTNIQQNNQSLLKGEETRFRLGESSIFMVNSREQKVLETQEKLNEYYCKRIKTIQYLKWLANSF